MTLTARHLACLLLVAFWALVPAGAAASEVALGSDGTLYRILLGPNGELFPEHGRNPDHTALGLEITQQDGATELLPVPGTEGLESEAYPSLIFEDASETLYIVWQGRVNNIHPVINLIGYREGDWTEVIEVTGSPFSEKSSPQLAVTRDRYLEEREGDTEPVERTSFHVIWTEEAQGGKEVYYSPVLLENGVYDGWNLVLPLHDFVESEEAGISASFPDSLFRRPRLVGGIDPQSIVIAFASESRGRLFTFKARLLPGELSRLADETGVFISGFDPTICDDEDGVRSLADETRMHIVVLGTRFHPGIRTHLADETASQVLEHAARDCEEGGLSRAGERARMHIVVLGAKVKGGALLSPDASDSTFIIDINRHLHGPQSERRLHLELERIADLPLPATGSVENGSARIHASRDGKRVLLSWVREGRLHYVESQNGEWSEVRTLELGEELDLNVARDMFDERVDQR